MKLVQCFIVVGKPGQCVCTRKHKDPVKCSRAHKVPSDALWSGWWPKDELGDLRSDVKYYRRKLRLALARWETRLARIKSVSAAPAFKAYHQSIIDEHVAKKPKFDFQPRRTHVPQTA